MKKSSRLISFLLTALTVAFLFTFSAGAANEKGAITLKASNIAKGVQLTWNADDEAVSYIIYRKEAAEKNKTRIAKVQDTKYTDDAAQPGKYYGYRVVPVLENSKTGTKSNDVFLNTLSTPEITKTANVLDGITVTWTASVGAKGYRLYRKAAGEKNWKTVGKTDAKTLSFTDKKVNSKDTYTYAVRGYNGSDYSHPSNYVSTHFTPAPKITRVASNKGNITIYWDKSEKAVSYQIYRKAPTDKSFSRVTTLNADQLKYTDTNVKAGTTYSYHVRAVNSDKQVSGVAKAATKCLYMGVPAMTAAENTSNGVKLTWTKAAGSQGYYIYRREVTSTTWKKVLAVKGAGSLYATDKTAQSGKDYVYVVRAAWNGIQSGYNVEGIAVRYLAPPQNVKVEAKGSSGNYITFTATKGAAKYRIYRKTDKTAWESLGYVTATAYLDKTAKEGTTYSYGIRAYYGSYRSAASDIVLSSRINPKGKMVALTYDDGPSNSVTNKILDILEKYDAKATFFVIGNRINANYQPMQRAVKMGCEIGNHTYSHINLPSYGYSDIRYEIDTTNSLIKKYTGITPKIVRAPGGSTDSYSRQTVNMPFIYWSVDTRDWESRSASSVISITKSETCDGSIILMHDIYDSTASASATIIPWLINQGYQLVTVSELMYYRGITMQKGVSYSAAYR